MITMKPTIHIIPAKELSMSTSAQTFILVLVLAIIATAGVALGQPEVTLLNVSYDPTRELYHEYNAAFAKHW